MSESEISDNSSDDTEVKGCIICLNTLELDLEHDEDDVRIVVLTCKHLFHKKCISRWLKKSEVCPMCRQLVDESIILGLNISSNNNSSDSESDLTEQINNDVEIAVLLSTDYYDDNLLSDTPEGYRGCTIDCICCTGPYSGRECTRRGIIGVILTIILIYVIFKNFPT